MGPKPTYPSVNWGPLLSQPSPSTPPILPWEANELCRQGRTIYSRRTQNIYHGAAPAECQEYSSGQIIRALALVELPVS